MWGQAGPRGPSREEGQDPEGCAGQRGVFNREAAGWDLAFRRHLGVEDRLRGAKWEAEGALRRGGSDTVELGGGHRAKAAGG